MKFRKTVGEKFYSKTQETLASVFEGRIFVGKVADTRDIYNSGAIKVEVDMFGKVTTIEAAAASPFGGAGYGFFGVPRPGSFVLLTHPENASTDSTGWVWFACLYRERYENKDQHSDVNVGDPISVPRRGVEEDTAKAEGKDRISSDVPDGNIIYEDNSLPDMWIWKSPNGHKIVLSEKETQEHIKNFIKMRSMSGKQITLDDSPSEQGGDNIRIQDEVGNSIIIQTGGEQAGWIREFALDTIEKVCKEGSIVHTVLGGSKGNIELENIGSGDITQKAFKGNVKIQSKKDTEVKSENTELLSEKSVTIMVGNNKVVVTPDSVTITAQGGEIYLGPGGARISSPGQPITFLGSLFNFITG